MSHSGAAPEAGSARQRLILPALVVSFPVLSHLSVVLGSAWLEWLALLVLCAIPQCAALLAGRWRHWALLLALAGGLAVLIHFGGGIVALKLPPILLPASIAAVFLGTLRAGQVPLVTRMAAAERGTLPPELLVYTRRVTQAWAVLCVGLSLAALAFALFAPLPLWSLFTNIISYVLIGLMFVGEYAWRRLRFRHLPHAGLLAFIRSLFRTDYRAV